jgi:hypothetical protein
MARIRSIHPTLFTDEAFASLSMPARVLLLGLWTEADDQGIFDWKPITLKMRILPVDSVDVAALLAELERADVIRKFQQDGKTLGAVRNFCKFQKPKTPKYRPLKSADIRNYVASNYPIPEIAAGEVEPFPQNGEMPPQMEDGGGNREEEEEEVSRSVAAATRPRADEFEEFWKAYPRREGPNPRKPAEQKFSALTKTGVDPAMMIAAVKRMAAEQSRDIGTRFIPQAITWLNQQRWTDHAAIAFSASAIPDKIPLEDAVRQYAKTGHWSRHAPISDVSLAPADLLAKHGLTPDGRRMQ